MLKVFPFIAAVCIGTNGRLSVPSNKQHHYRNLRDRYTNCTYVDGNLEITWLQNETFDLSFLQYIREVTGYVLISHVDVKKVVLPRLQIIRGRTLFKLTIHDTEFALFVTMCQMQNLEMPALRGKRIFRFSLLINENVIFEFRYVLPSSFFHLPSLPSLALTLLINHLHSSFLPTYRLCLGGALPV